MASELSRLGPEYGLVACQDLAVDADGVPIPTLAPRLARDRDVTARDLTLMNRFPPSVLARKAVLLAAGGFDTALTSSEDRDLWIRCALRARIRLLASPLLRKRRHGANMSRHAERQSRNIRAVLRKAFGCGVAPGWDLLFRARVWAMYHFQAALMQEGVGAWSRGLRHLLASFLLHPSPGERQALRQPRLYRCRTLARLVRGLVLNPGAGTA